MPSKLEISPYTQVGHLSWGKNRTWLSDPDHKGITLSSEDKQQIEDLGQTLGLSAEDAKQAIYEGEIAARIEVDPEFAATLTISGLEAESRSARSPLACVARELRLIRMIQEGKIVGFVVKNSGKDIVSKPVYGLTLSPHGDPCIGLTIGDEEKWILLMSKRTT